MASAQYRRAVCPRCSCEFVIQMQLTGGRPPTYCGECRLDRLTEPRTRWHKRCEHCSKDFVALVEHARWCSKRCGKAGRKRENPEASRAEYLEKERRRKAKRFADPAHGLSLARHRLLDALKRRRAQLACNARASKPCAVCGMPVGFRHSVYCSQACRERSPVTVAVRRKSKETYRARKRAAVVIRFDPVEVFERDKWKCRLCGVATPQSLRGKHKPNSPELDHIVPLSKSGLHAPWATQLLCRKCNRSKSNKALGQLWLAGVADTRPEAGRPRPVNHFEARQEGRRSGDSKVDMGARSISTGLLP